jgi:hypothetical protein
MIAKAARKIHSEAGMWLLAAFVRQQSKRLRLDAYGARKSPTVAPG